MKYLILYNFLISIFMFSVILMTQIVNYPLFSNISQNQLINYHSSYVKKISYIVIPAMSSEIAVALFLFYYHNSFLTISSLSVIILIFISTMYIQVPIHNKISKDLIKKLILTNWIRTILWLLKSIISIKLLNKELL